MPWDVTTIFFGVSRQATTVGPLAGLGQPTDLPFRIDTRTVVPSGVLRPVLRAMENTRYLDRVGFNAIDNDIGPRGEC